ncbi:MAG: ABC transporter ATP-binding protein [Armatimonadota bacterium]|nr:ABC transporter ATP-binding protein [Armatimonadota bacterium]
MAYAVRLEEVTKRYSGGGPRYASLRHELSEGVRRLAARLRGLRPEPRGTLALDRVSFEVEEGEAFAIIGPNGAGKTTALKLVSRISYPTGGRVRVRGRVAALIEVGSGVHPELTARENIWLYGQILGMSRAEIRRRFDEIVEFAELAHVLDTPVKMYSSGMQLRLGFAIASHLEPDIFVVDEALAVGDAGFQAKCVERMTKLVGEGRTLLFVSHNLSAVEAVCTRGLFLLDGQVRKVGRVRQALRAYMNWVDAEHQARLGEEIAVRPSTLLHFEGICCYGADGGERYAFRTGEDVELRLRFRPLAPLRRPYVSLGITDGRPGNLILCSMLVDGGAPECVEDPFEARLKMRSLPLLPRVYQLWCSVRTEHAFGDVFDWQPVGTFRVTEPPSLSGPAAVAHTSTDGPVHVDHYWEVVPCR